MTQWDVLSLRRASSCPTDLRDALNARPLHNTFRPSLQSPSSDLNDRPPSRALTAYLKLAPPPRPRRESTPSLHRPPPLRRDAPSSPHPAPRDWSYERDAFFARYHSQQDTLFSRGTAGRRGSVEHKGLLVDVDPLPIPSSRRFSDSFLPEVSEEELTPGAEDARHCHGPPFVYDSWGAPHPTRPSENIAPTHPMVLLARRRLPPPLILAPLSPTTDWGGTCTGVTRN